VVGSGRTAIARALTGVDYVTAGSFVLEGRRLHFRQPADATAAGVALIPENRKADGLFWNFTGLGNITISRLPALLRGPLMSLRREDELGGTFIRRLRIDPAAAWRLVGMLSGGTQQKVMIARWLFAGVKVLVLDEPTQGIDVGAKVEVYRLINSLTAEGVGVILISSDYRELLAMSDRIAVIREGRVAKIVPAAELDEYAIIAAAPSPVSTRRGWRRRARSLSGVLTTMIFSRPTWRITSGPICWLPRPNRNPCPPIGVTTILEGVFFVKRSSWAWVTSLAASFPSRTTSTPTRVFSTARA
jgi:ribose transport system ATP-binding protein